VLKRIDRYIGWGVDSAFSIDSSIFCFISKDTPIVTDVRNGGHHVGLLSSILLLQNIVTVAVKHHIAVGFKV
jgi:hypothetical protein